MRVRSVGRLLLVLVVLLVLQDTVVLDIRIAGVHPDLVLLAPIALGISGGAEAGAVGGFVAGMAADLLLPTPFGLTALIGCLVGFAVGATTGSTTRELWFMPVLVAVAASAVGVIAYAALGAVLGQEQFLDANLPAIVAVVGVVNALLVLPAVRVAGWVLAPSRAERAAALAPGRRW